MRKMHKNRISINNFLKSSLLILLLFLCCDSHKNEGTAPLSIEADELNEAIDQFQVIGEGTDFLTVKIDLPQGFTPDYTLIALILDQDNFPLRKVSGYIHDPRLQGKNHRWFYFFLYSPGQAIPFMNRSEYIKFIATKENSFVMEKVVKYQKIWGSEDSPKIFDLPSPPGEIKGYLVLKDYTFLAEGDFRKPEGYFVEGKISGDNRQWTHFIVLSSIQGQESEPEFILPVDQGWLELTTGKTHSMQEAISPSPPYVEGWWDGKGYFHPKPVKIHGLF